MDRAARSLMCLFGLKCRRGLDCHCGHTDVEKKLFADRKALREKEWMAPCGFCAVGRCRYGAECQRSIRSRLTNEAYRNHSAPAESESDYESAESGCDSCDDSADEAGLAQVECGAEAPEGAVPDCALAPFLSEDYTKVVKGWRPNVGSADVGQRGFGEASVYWLLDYVELKPPALAIGDQCEVDAIGFVFQKSEGAAMSQKAQRRIAQQKKVEVVWAGPAVVREQSAVSRVSVGHRGATARKALFESGDEGSSDGIGDSSGGGFEGGCSRAENKARQRSTIIRNVCKNTPVFTARQDKAEVERRAAVKSVRRSLPEDPNVAVSLVVEMESQREEATKRRCEAELAEVSAAKMSAANVQSMRKLQVWEWRQRMQSQQVWVRRFFQGWAWGWERQRGRQRRLRGINEVRLFRAACVFIGLKRPFQLWNRWCRNAVADRIWCGCAVRDLLAMVEFWELGMAWRQWKFWMGVHRAEEVLRRFGMERIRGATRQWVFNLWCSVCSTKMAAVAKAASDEEAAMKSVDAAKMAAAAVEEKADKAAVIIERAAKAIRVYGYDQMNTVAARQNLKWCSVVWSLCELLGM